MQIFLMADIMSICISKKIMRFYPTTIHFTGGFSRLSKEMSNPVIFNQYCTSGIQRCGIFGEVNL